MLEKSCFKLKLCFFLNIKNFQTINSFFFFYYSKNFDEDLRELIEKRLKDSFISKILFLLKILYHRKTFSQKRVFVLRSQT